MDDKINGLELIMDINDKIKTNEKSASMINPSISSIELTEVSYLSELNTILSGIISIPNPIESSLSDSTANDVYNKSKSP